jgi:uncharacterized protein
MKSFLIFFIHAYRWFISPFLPSSCRYNLTCSRYAIYVIETHGVIKGVWLTFKRIIKCNPYTDPSDSWSNPIIEKKGVNTLSVQGANKKV